MENQTKKWMATASFALCALCLFVAVERYNTNANNVHAMNAMQGNPGGFGQLLGGGHLEPATPTATKYAGFFAVLFAAGGLVLLLNNDASGEQKRNSRN